MLLPLFTVRVTFDKPLLPTGKNQRDYFIRWSNVDRDPTTASVPVPAPTRLILTTAVIAPDLGPDVITYNGADPLMIGQNGVRVGPFSVPIVPG